MEDMIRDKIMNEIKERALDQCKIFLGVEDKDDDKDKGLFSFLGGGDREKDKEKGGLFSFGNDKKKDDDDDGGFMSKIFGKKDDDDDDDHHQKKSGFHGLFSEQGCDARERGGGGGEQEGQTLQYDGDLFQDLMDAAGEKE